MHVYARISMYLHIFCTHPHTARLGPQKRPSGSLQGSSMHDLRSKIQSNGLSQQIWQVGVHPVVQGRRPAPFENTFRQRFADVSRSIYMYVYALFVVCISMYMCVYIPCQSQCIYMCVYTYMYVYVCITMYMHAYAYMHVFP